MKIVNIKNTKSKGFTLIELLVVIAIGALLASIIIPFLNTARARARDSERKSDLRQLQKVLEIYYSDHDAYPVVPGIYFLNETTAPPNNTYVPNLVPFYLKVLPHDPRAGQPVSGCPSDAPTGFQYYSNGTEYKVRDKCVVEEPISPGNPFYDPSPSFVDYAPYSYSIYTSGGANY